MKKTRVLAVLFLIWVEGSGQSVDYVAELNQPVLWGDARYNGLSGAMTAMSGSFTALAENPAGAGLTARLPLEAIFLSTVPLHSKTVINSQPEMHSP